MKALWHPFALFSANVILLLLSSCKSTEPIVYTPLPIEHKIHESIEKDNVGELIQHYKNHPNYRTMLVDYLTYDRDYSKDSYRALLLYQQEAAKDSVLADIFESIVLQREYHILTQLSECPLPEIVDYYKQNIAERRFLAPALRNTVLHNLDEYDYPTLRQMRRLFMDTEFEEDIDNIYQKAKKIVMVDVKKNLQEYCKDESAILMKCKDGCLSEVQQRVSSSLQLFIEELFDKDLPEGKNAVNDYFTKVLDKQIKERIEMIINNNISSCVDNLNKGRTMYLMTLMEEQTFKGYQMEREHTFVNLQVNASVCQPLYELSEIQNKTDWTGWGMTTVSTLAGLFSFGLASAAIDAIDVGRSIKNAKEDAEKSKILIDRFVKNLSIELQQTSRQIVESSFDTAKRRLNQSQKNFKNIVYENY